MIHRASRLLIAVAALLFMATPAAAQVDFTIKNTMTPGARPLDVAAAVDGNKVFVLAEGGKLHIYGADGQQIDVINVDPRMERISVAGLQAAGIEDKIYLTGPKAGMVQELSLSFAVRIDTQGAPILGNPKAAVELVEFSDFECPFCSQAGPLLKQILAKFPDQVKVVFKHLPLGNHKNARPAALASMAAQNQGKFWEFHDRLFEEQKNLGPDKIRAIATELKLDMARFDRDLVSPELARRLEKEISDARLAMVRGTPAIFVNGRELKQRTSENLQQMVEEELKKSAGRGGR